MTTANQVADFFLFFAKEHGDFISQLKLQKLVYYADAWHMVNNEGSPLVQENFEAWVHGPVVRDLYRRFREYKWNPILGDFQKPEIAEEVESHLIDIYEAFAKFNGFELEQMTHDELPWTEARGSCAPDDSCENIINKNTMFNFYLKVAEES